MTPHPSVKKMKVIGKNIVNLSVKLVRNVVCGLLLWNSWMKIHNGLYWNVTHTTMV